MFVIRTSPLSSFLMFLRKSLNFAEEPPRAWTMEAAKAPFAFGRDSRSLKNSRAALSKAPSLCSNNATPVSLELQA